MTTPNFGKNLHNWKETHFSDKLLNQKKSGSSECLLDTVQKDTTWVFPDSSLDLNPELLYENPYIQMSVDLKCEVCAHGRRLCGVIYNTRGVAVLVFLCLVYPLTGSCLIPYWTLWHGWLDSISLLCGIKSDLLNNFGLYTLIMCVEHVVQSVYKN